MNVLGISTEWLQRLAGSLLHFVWQGALLALAAAIVLRLLARRPAIWRYVVSVIFLGLMLLAPCVTVIFYPEAGSAALRILRIFRASAGSGASVNSEAILQWTGWIVLAWATGVTASSLRLITGWFLSLRLIRSSQSTVPLVVEQLFRRVHSALLTTRKMPRLLIGERVTGPVVFGWIRPVVLLPASIATGLSEEQLLAVLAHELAHIRRYDFLVNALQRGVETVLFYHPGVWWLSSRIRIEREHCCDDLALRVCGDRFAYAEALIELERLRSETLALAVSGTASLTERIRRMLGAEHRNKDWQPAMVALMILCICVVAGQWQGDPLTAPVFAAPPVSDLAPIVEPPAPSAAASLESAVGALEAIATAQPPQATPSSEHWVTTWGAAYSPAALTKPVCCNNQTVRMFMRVSMGASSVRLRLSNMNGSAPLFLGRVHIALHDRGSEIVPGSDRQVLFSGTQSVEVPIGQTITSDPVNMDLPALADVAISIYAPNETGAVSGFNGNRNGYVVSGDQASSQGMTGANLTKTRYWVSGIEVLASASSNAIMVVVDQDIPMESDSGRSWPDFLAPRLQGNNATKARSVVLSNDASRILNSPDTINDIVAGQTGVRYLMLCPGFGLLFSIARNMSRDELNKGVSFEDLISRKFQSMIEQAHNRGISTIACTLPSVQVRAPEFIFAWPGGVATYKDAQGQERTEESLRSAINEWMRSGGVFDGLADFDAVTRDSANSVNIKPEFRSSSDTNRNFLNDHAHQAIAEAIDLSMFTR